MSDPYLGEIMMFGGNFAIRGWAFCSGEMLPIAQHTALFSILGSTYGGDGRTTFALPDFRGRVPMSSGRGPGLSSWRLGQKFGAETTTLNSLNLPVHSHTLSVARTVPQSVSATATLYAEKGSASTSAATDNLLAVNSSADIYKAPQSSKDNQAMSSESVVIDPIAIPAQALSGATDTFGASQSFNNMQPSLVVNFLIAMQGIFPSRN